MKINAKIDRMVNAGNIKAIASVTLDGQFVVKNLKVMDGRKGLFVSMPQESFTGRGGEKKYSNLFFALTNAAKMDLQDAVLQAYQQQLHAPDAPQQTSSPQTSQTYRERQYPQPQYPEPQYPDWANDYGDVLPMEMG